MSEPLEEFCGASFDQFKNLAIPEAKYGYLILGPVGTGKTHLAAAFYYRTPGEKIFATARNWLRAFKAEFDGGTIPELPPEEDAVKDGAYNPAVYLEPKIIKGRSLGERASVADLVVIDDYGAHGSTTWAREQLVGILDDRTGARRKTIVTTNLSPSAIKAVDERFFDRMRFLERITLKGKSRRNPT